MISPKYLVFRISGQKFAIKYNKVLDISSVPKSIKILHGGKDYQSMEKQTENRLNYTMINLCSHLGIIPGISTNQSIIIVSSESVGINASFGLLVDEVTGMFNIDTFSFFPYKTLMNKNVNDIRDAIAIVDNEPIIILNVDKLQYLNAPVSNAFELTLAMLN